VEGDSFFVRLLLEDAEGLEGGFLTTHLAGLVEDLHVAGLLLGRGQGLVSHSIVLLHKHLLLHVIDVELVGEHLVLLGGDGVDSPLAFGLGGLGPFNLQLHVAITFLQIICIELLLFELHGDVGARVGLADDDAHAILGDLKLQDLGLDIGLLQLDVQSSLALDFFDSLLDVVLEDLDGLGVLGAADVELAGDGVLVLNDHGTPLRLRQDGVLLLHDGHVRDHYRVGVPRKLVLYQELLGD